MKPDAQTPERSEAGPGTLRGVAIALAIVDMLLIGLERYASGPVRIPELLGAVLAPIIVTVLIIWLAQMFNRATSPRGAAKVAVVIMAMFAVGSCGGLLTAVSESGAAAGHAALLAKRTAAHASKNIPPKIDRVTRLNAVTSTGDTLAYWFQRIDITASELDQGSATAWKTQVTERACGDSAVRSGLLGQGVVIRFNYADNADRTMASVDVTDAVCGGAR